MTKAIKFRLNTPRALVAEAQGGPEVLRLRSLAVLVQSVLAVAIAQRDKHRRGRLRHEHWLGEHLHHRVHLQHHVRENARGMWRVGSASGCW